MKLLEYYHTQSPNITNYIVRKTQISTEKKINLFGVRGAGKSALVLDYLQEEEKKDKILYIDFEDPNLFFETITLFKLEAFIKEHNIEILVFDHYNENYFENFFMIEVKKLIIISRIPLKTTSLHPIELFPLDYEEFLAFDTTSSIQTKGFKHFLRLGTLPYCAISQKHHLLTIKRFLQSQFTINEQKLLHILATHNTKHLTIHQIFTFAKDEFKVSKDWIYKTIKAFQEEKIIFFIENNHKKSGKKMILFDFSFAKYLSKEQSFITQFDTMLALTFIKNRIPFSTLGIHGYLTERNELIISAPFENEESMWVKSQSKFSTYRKFTIQKVTIVTMTNRYEFSIQNIYFEALPFEEWSVISEED